MGTRGMLEGVPAKSVDLGYMSAVRQQVKTVRCIELSILCARNFIVERNAEPPSLSARVRFADEECSTHVYAGGCHPDAQHDVLRLHCTDDVAPELEIALYDVPNFHVGTASVDLRQFTSTESTTFILEISTPGDFQVPPSLNLGEIAVRF